MAKGVISGSKIKGRDIASDETSAVTPPVKRLKLNQTNLKKYEEKLKKESAKKKHKIKFNKKWE